MSYNIGIDVGRTFTYFLVTDAQGGAKAYKTPTTPKQPEVGVFRGLEKIAVLTNTGAKTSFLTTKGFRDLLNMRRGLKEHPYDSKYAPPLPLVPRHRVY